MNRDMFQGEYDRSFPGQPPRERHGKAYNMPFADLNLQQRTAASQVLGIQDERGWELAMPRRICSCSTSIVLEFQPKTWSQLTTEQQKLAKDHLDLSVTVWNNTLAIFHDDLWSIPEITLTSEEFKLVLSVLKKMLQHQVLARRDVARFLRDLGKLLLPSQATQIAELLKASSSWENLTKRTSDCFDGYNLSYAYHVQLVVASFLTYPEQFVDIPHMQLNLFWNDDNSGCTWGNANPGDDDTTNKKSYRDELNDIRVRRCVASILTRTLPARVQTQQVMLQLPVLPKLVVQHILDDMLGTNAKVTANPLEVFLPAC